MSTHASDAATRSPSARRPLEAATLLCGITLLAAAALVASFFTFVRGEPRPELALSSGLAITVAAVLVLRRVPGAPLLAVALSLFLVLFPALRKYYAFSLERPDETVGLVFSVAALAVAGVAATTGLTATVARFRLLPPTRAAAGVAATVGLVAAVVTGALIARTAPPDQGADLSDAELAALPQVVMDDFRFTPDRIEIVTGEDLVVRLVNDDTETYRFTIDELDVDVVVPSGRSAVARVTPAAAGTLTFYSSEEGGEHRDLGMVGEIVVAP
ncbi:MAG: cupredoxin domain-containing protein [Actinomycetales bacterium]